MTDDEGLSVREAVDWCGSGVTVREVTRLRRLAQDAPGAAADERATVSAAAGRARTVNKPAAVERSRWRLVRALGIRPDLPMSGCS